MSGPLEDGSYRINIHNGLLLYYHQYSFYSQKVLMALHEKKLKFESHVVNLSQSVQYQPWFLQLNPRGEVPVLQDTGKIITDSNNIIDYLEDNFHDGDIPRLIPMDEPELRQKVTYFRHLLEQIPSGIITIGSFNHSDLVENPKIPFTPCVRKMLINPERNSVENLRKHAEKNPKSKDVLLQKIEAQQKKHELISNKEEYEKVLNKLDELLDKIEEELSLHKDKKDFWLCSDSFTIADINLTILLERLCRLGFENRFWKKGKRPFLENYYERAKQRESYKKTMPNIISHIKMFISANRSIAIGITAVTAMAIALGGYFIVKNII